MRKSSKVSLLTMAVIVLSAHAAFGQQTLSDVIWTGMDSNDWNVETNWMGGFVPSLPLGGERAVIDNGGMAFIDTNAIDSVGGLRIDDGTLEIRNLGALDVVTDVDLDDPEEGISFIGGTGRGQLDVLAGGAFNTDTLLLQGAADSTLSLSGTAAMEVANDANLNRITRITGPDATVEIGGNLTLGGTLVPVITAGTHSPIQVSLGNATLGGTLRPEFSGGFTPVLGDRWTLISANSVTGSFASIDTSQAPAVPRGATFAVAVLPGVSTEVELSLANRLVLTVDRASGAMSVANIIGAEINVDSYTIGSPSGLLDPDGWQSLQDSSIAGWEEANPSANFLAELNAMSTSTLRTTDGPLSLGNAYGFQPTKLGEAGTDLTFVYSGPTGGVVSGLIEYTGPDNNLVLSVDPATGDSVLTNDSMFNVDLLAYSIDSVSGSLQPGNWNSLDDQGQAGWEEANPTANALSELNPMGSLAMAPGSSVNLGMLFDTGGSQDLSLEFLYEIAGGPVGDTNGDGKVDIDDLNNVRNLFGSNDPAGDTNGDGTVNIDDLNNVRNNFGAMGGGGGGVQEIINGIVRYESTAPAPVPEPAAWSILAIGLAGLWSVRRRTGCHRDA